jgi:hypothetical protein
MMKIPGETSKEKVTIAQGECGCLADGAGEIESGTLPIRRWKHYSSELKKNR